MPRSRHGTSGEHLEREERRDDDGGKATPHAVVCSAARRWTLQSQVFPFPSVLSADGLTFKPDNDLLVLVRDADVRLYCAQADVLWVDYLNFKATQFPMMATKSARPTTGGRSKSR